MDTSKHVYANNRLRQERIRRNWRQQDVADQLGISVVTVKRWERGSQQPSTYFRQKLCVLFDKSAEELGLLPEIAQTLSPTKLESEISPGLPSPPPLRVSLSLWSVPYPRNPFFTGREDCLLRMHEVLHRQHTMALTQSVAISGLGGIGKTQIALEYAYRYRQEYRFVFWTNAATRESLLADFIGIAELLQLPEKDERDQNRTILAVRKWFATHQEWLLILDNADQVEMLHNFLPLECPGHLVLTSRAQALGALAQGIVVEDMGLAEGALFLLRRAKLLAPDASLNKASEKQLTEAEAIVIEMAFLPLALDQAGAYIDEIGCSLSTYLDLYRTHRQELLQRRGHMSSDYPASVATTWSLSFQQVEQVNPAAAELLRFCAFLEPDTIPEDLLNEGSAALSPVLQQIAKDGFALNEAIEALRKFSLIYRNPDKKTLRVHRLIQVVLQDSLQTRTRRRWAERAVRATSCAFPQAVEMDTWPRCLRYLSQAQLCTVLIQDYAFAFADAASLLYRTAVYLGAHALYEQAVPLYEQAISIWKQALGTEHPDVATALHRLADVYRLQGKYQDAEPLYRQALGIREQALGSEHPDVAQSLNGLAILARLQGKYEQAELLCQRALSIWEQALGSEHPDVAQSLNGLAILARLQNNFTQAEALYRRALHIWEQAFGPTHHFVATSLNNLADLYQEQGVYEQAEPLYQQALSMWKLAVGPEHPYVAYTLHNLAELSRVQGNYQQAEPLYQQALHIWEQAFGPEHPNVSYALNGLANLYHLQEKHEEAELLYRRALHIREQALGLEHHESAETLHDFAAFQCSQGKKQEAAELYQRALAVRERIFGPHHPKTVETRKAYTELLHTMEQGA